LTTKYCRFLSAAGPVHGVIEGDRIVPVEGDIFSEYARIEGDAVSLKGAQLLAPVIPRKVLAAAVNYQSHVPSGKAVLKDGEAPGVPQLFLKPSSSLIGPEDDIILPAEARRVDAEGELVAVIGKACKKVTVDEALRHVLGYTCGNDVSARHWQRDDVQWWRAKGSDTFTAAGPVIATGLDPANLQLLTRINGEEKQSASTGMLIHSLAEIISFASQVMTLEPGDLVFTGTPGETPRLEDGDVVEVEIDGVGVLRNGVKRELGVGS
jgi:2-keto-4-pentenoate hydratase/2-oxohepta-3-ene-1,7-dioic acid hydratase in catechol pathway